MTPKQIERIQKKISDIKRRLAAEKRMFGAYDDSSGMRYIPTRYYLELGDYAGGLKYLKWFATNFPDDVGFPDFLFEWTVILFKNGKLKEAERKAFETFSSNTYFFDKYFGRQISPIQKWEGSNVAEASYVDYLKYSSTDTDLNDFTEWLRKFTSSERFLTLSEKFVAINIKLKTEHNIAERRNLSKQIQQLEEEW
jgi:hypothetical protein